MKKTILVKQRDISDCGAACLASVIAYFGLHIPVSRIRQYAGTGRQGTNLRGLIEAAELLHFQARGAKAKGMVLTNIPVPTIFHLVLENGLQHFVVVYKIKRQRVCLMDPAIGKLITRPLPDFEKTWSGVILLLAPSDQFQRGNEKKSVLIRFWQLILPHRSLLMQALLGAGIYTLLGLSTSIYVQKIFDFGLPDANKSLISLLSLIMIGLLFFRMITGYLKSILALRTGQQIDSRLILGYYKHLLELPQRFFDGMRVGEIISRVNDAVRIRIFINDVALGVVVNLFSLLLCITAMFLYHWKLAMVVLFSLPVYLLIYKISNRVNAKWQRTMMESGAALESQLVESIQGVTTIRRFGSAEWFNLKMENRFVPMMRAVFTSSRIGLLLAHTTEGVTGLLTIGILWAGSLLVIDRILSPGELMSFYTLIVFFSGPVQTLISANRSMQDALIAGDRLFEIIDLETEKMEKKGVDRFTEGDLVFNEVHFSYGSGNPVFSGLQLRIPQNEMSAVMGESGCGKSTLLSLAQKLYPLNAGNIQIGEMDIRDISTDVLRNRIAAVPQHTDLFQGDFISNIALGDPQPDLERVFDICHHLGLDEMINQYPARYQTIIREQGINLSGGQKQKIGIARAIYPDPAILFLDEATSALDPESERKVQETLRWFSGFKKTIVIIAHRQASVKYCDSLIYLKQGKAFISRKHPSRSAEANDYAGWWANYE